MSKPELTREQKLDIIRRLRPIDDTFFTALFHENIALTELILKIILEKDDLEVLEVHTQYHTQYVIKSLSEHSATLDVLARDSRGHRYNIEVQQADRGAIARRARFYSGLLDSISLPKSTGYKELCDNYVIFITENDVLEEGLPLYHVERMVMETNKPFNDGMHIIYVNGANTDDTALGRLMHDFRTNDPHSMNYDLLGNRSRYFKEEKEGVEYMCRIVTDVYDKGVDQGIMIGEKKGRDETITEMVLKANRKGRSPEQIADWVDIPIERVHTILNTNA